MVATNLPPLIQFGVDASMQNSAQLVLFNAVVVDTAAVGLGTNASNGYLIRSGATLFNTVAAGTGAVLPPTSSLFGSGGMTAGMSCWIGCGNTANFLTVYPHPNDVGGTINGQSSVVIGANTVTPFQSFPAGLWLADSIGTGAAGSVETIVPQVLVAAGGSQATASQITQALVVIPSGTGGVRLMTAAPGLSIQIINNSGVNINLYSNAATASDNLNGANGTTTPVVMGNNTMTLVACAATSGSGSGWWTK